jgi:hypothetical protein
VPPPDPDIHSPRQIRPDAWFGQLNFSEVTTYRAIFNIFRQKTINIPIERIKIFEPLVSRLDVRVRYLLVGHELFKFFSFHQASVRIIHRP